MQHPRVMFVVFINILYFNIRSMSYDKYNLYENFTMDVTCEFNSLHVKCPISTYHIIANL